MDPNPVASMMKARGWHSQQHRWNSLTLFARPKGGVPTEEVVAALELMGVRYVVGFTAGTIYVDID